MTERYFLDTGATAVVRPPTRESYVGPVMPSDSRAETLAIKEAMLASQAKGLPANPTVVEDPEAFRKQGDCRDKDPNIFYPSDSSGVEVARAICRSCVVKEECLEFALTQIDRNDQGVWGGTSQRQRKRIRKNRNITNSSSNNT